MSTPTIPASTPTPAEALDQHLMSVIPASTQRKAVITAIHDAIDAAIAAYHADRQSQTNKRNQQS